jgi:hypothetical protein
VWGGELGGGEVRHSVFNHIIRLQLIVSRVFLEQLTIPQKTKNFSAFYVLRISLPLS